MSDFTSILIINNVPVAHSTGRYSELLEVLLDETGTLFVESKPYEGARVDTVEQLEDWCDIHAGLMFDCCGLYDASGEIIDWYILTDPFYRFELDDDVATLVEEYCQQHGIIFE